MNLLFPKEESLLGYVPRYMKVIKKKLKRAEPPGIGLWYAVVRSLCRRWALRIIVEPSALSLVPLR